MASIQTEITLIDKVSSAANNMVNSINRVASSYEKLSSASNVDLSLPNVSNGANELKGLNNTTNKLGKSFKDVELETVNLNSGFADVTSGIMGLKDGFSGFLASYLSFEGAQKFTQFSDSISNSQARIRIVNDGLQSVDALNYDIYSSAQRARMPYATMNQLVEHIGINAKDVFDNTQQIVQFVELIGKQLTIAGVNSDDARASIIQLTNAMGDGVLQGQAFKSILSEAPNIIVTIGNYLHKSNGEIRKMASEGKLTTDILKNAVLGSAKEINKEFSVMPVTFAQAVTKMQNMFTYFSLGINENINKILNGANTVEIGQIFEGFVATVSESVNRIVESLGALMQSNTFLTIGYDFLQGLSLVLGGISYGVEALSAAFNKLDDLFSSLPTAFVGFDDITTGFFTLLTGVTAVSVVLRILSPLFSTVGTLAGIAASGLGFLSKGMFALLGGGEAASAAMAGVDASNAALAGSSGVAAAGLEGEAAAAGVAAGAVEGVGIATMAAGAECAASAGLFALPFSAIIILIALVLGAMVLIGKAIGAATGQHVTAIGAIVGAFYFLEAIVEDVFKGIWFFIKVVAAAFKDTFMLAVYGVQMAFWALENYGSKMFEFLISGAIKAAYGIRNAFVTALNWVIDKINLVIGLAQKVPGAKDTGLSKINKIGMAKYDPSKGIVGEIEKYRKGLKKPTAPKPTAVKDPNFKNPAEQYNKGVDFGNSITDKLKKLVDFSGKDKDTQDKSKDLQKELDEAMKNANKNKNVPTPVDDKGKATKDTSKSSKETEKHTKKMAKDVKNTTEDLKYLRDLSEQEAIDRMTAINLQMNINNHNSINSDLDIDHVNKYIVDNLAKELNNRNAVSTAGLKTNYV